MCRAIIFISVLYPLVTTQFSGLPCDLDAVGGCLAAMLQSPELQPTSRQSCQSVQIRCRFYQAAKDCIERVAYCSIDQIGGVLKHKLERSPLATMGCLTENGGKTRRANLHVYIAMWGFLREKCERTKCDKRMLTECEIEIGQRNGNQANRYYLQRYLMNQLNASALLIDQFPAENPKQQCAITVATLNSLHKLHYQYCFHHKVTQCVCERHRLNNHCGIRCDEYSRRNSADRTKSWVMQFVSSSANGWLLPYRHRFDHFFLPTLSLLWVAR